MSGLRLRRIKWKREPSQADVWRIHAMLWITGQAGFRRGDEWAFTTSSDPRCYFLPDGEGWEKIDPVLTAYSHGSAA